MDNLATDWELVSYSWDELTGMARFVYERGEDDVLEHLDRFERRIVDASQPANPSHTDWDSRALIDYDTVRASYFENQLIETKMRALGAYGLAR